MRALLLLALALITAPFPARAIEPEQVERIAYRLSSFDGAEHGPAASLSAGEEIVLLADTVNIIDPRQTLVYYWPLSRSFRADWDRLDVEAAGELEIADEEGDARTLRRESVVTVYPAGVGGGFSLMMAGAEAEKARRSYEQIQSAFNRALSEATRARIAHERLLRDNPAEARKRPPPPPDPVPPPLFVSEPRSAFVLNLPAGDYRLRLKRDGRIVEGSERRLRVVSPIASGSVTWQVIPEERWTRRLAAEHPESAIYAAPGATLYLVPFRADAYRAADIARLKDPQAPLPPPGEQWIVREPLTGTRLLAGDVEAELKPYRVVQRPGAALGYRIEEASAPQEAELFAFALGIPDELAGKDLRLGLVDAGTGEPVPGAGRTIRILAAERYWLAWCTAALPLLPALFLFLGRRRRSGAG
ncbi:hypothetical protein [Chelativorans sp.]|uniref:hypothetical protein n=1 Tax=Chelativorans sp. TaxID=2203393 RepID=UPI0028110736|nr:hypothetical protein [Chelativorans sp.]